LGGFLLIYFNSKSPSIGASVMLFGFSFVEGILCAIMMIVLYRIYLIVRCKNKISEAMKDCIHPDVKNRGENPEIESAWELYNRGSRLESEGRLEEALLAYDECSSNFAETGIANDAEISANEIQKRIKS